MGTSAGKLLRARLGIVAVAEELPVRVENGSLRVAGARTVFEDILGSNGVLHMIHTVLQ